MSRVDQPVPGTGRTARPAGLAPGVHMVMPLKTHTLAGGLLACLAVATIPSHSSAAGGTQTLRIFEQTKSVQLTKADGRVLKQLPIAEPEPGDVVDIVFDIFAGDHVKHGKTRLGSDHLRCEFVP